MPPTKIACIPFLLWPDTPFEFVRCKPIPGVILSILQGSLKALINEQGTKLPIGNQPNFSPTHVIIIDKKEYFSRLEQRLRREGKGLPDINLPAARDKFDFILDTHAITKQIILTLVLLSRTQFQVGGYYSLNMKINGKRKHYMLTGYSHAPSIGSFRSGSFLPSPVQAVVLTRYIKQKAELLDVYYRSGSWSEDRLSMALGYYWTAMCTPFQDQTFVSLTMALEAALSTNQNEITHQLSERISVLLRNDIDQRLEKYSSVKNLYNTRSKLVHGAAGPKSKGPLTTESLAVMARRTFVPHSQLKSLMELTTEVLNRLLHDREYLGIIRNLRNEDTINKRLNELFVRRILQ